MKKVSIILMIITVLSKILGFIRELILSSTFGKSVVADAFIFSFNLPSTIFAIIIGAVVTGFIPMFTRVEKEEGEQKAQEFMNNTFNSMLIIAFVFSAVIFVFTEPILRSSFLSNASEELMTLAVPFVKVTIFSVMATCVVQLMTGFLQIRNSFIFPMLMGFPMNIVIILFILASKNMGNDILPYGTLFGIVAQAVVIFAYAYVKGYRYSFKINIKDKHLHRMIFLALPLMMASGANSIGTIITNSLASGYSGGLSLINYSTKLGAMVDGVFGVAIVSVVYPQLSRAISLNQIDKAQEEMSDSMISILLFVLPAAVGLYVLAEPISRFVFQSQQFNSDSILQMVPVLQAYAIGIPFFSIYSLIVKVFYSYQDMKTPTYVSIATLVVLVIVAIGLDKVMGVTGIMLANTISFALAVFIDFYLLRRKFKQFNYRQFFGQLIKIFIAGAVMGIAVYFSYVLLAPRLGLRLSVMGSIIVAAGVYLVLVLLLHIKAVDEMIESVRVKFRG